MDRAIPTFGTSPSVTTVMGYKPAGAGYSGQPRGWDDWNHSCSYGSRAVGENCDQP